MAPLIDIAHLGAGDAVVIPAASSSVGLAAIQIARRAGATPIATTRTGAKRAALLEAGRRGGRGDRRGRCASRHHGGERRERRPRGVRPRSADGRC